MTMLTAARNPRLLTERFFLLCPRKSTLSPAGDSSQASPRRLSDSRQARFELEQPEEERGEPEEPGEEDGLRRSVHQDLPLRVYDRLGMERPGHARHHEHQEGHQDHRE